MRNKVYYLIMTILFISTICTAQLSNLPPYKDSKNDVEIWVADLLSRMTLEEKIEMLGGENLNTKKNIRLGIPKILMSDGPLGPTILKHSTNYSAIINLAASFDADLMRRVAESIGEENPGDGEKYASISKEKMTESDSLFVEVIVTNTGKVYGDEVVQLYIHDIEASVEREPKSLKGFKRVSLKAGESKTVSMKIDKSALSFYDVDSKAWVAESGEFEVLIGASSRDIRLKSDFELK